MIGLSRALFLVPVLVLAQGTSVDVGTGSPNEAVRAGFVNAFFRSGFARLVSLPPAGEVRRFGNTGYIQEFNDATRPGTRHALVRPTLAGPAEGPDTFQVRAPVFSYYNSVGVNTAGYPTGDTLACPDANCSYQFFDRRYALFAYDASLEAGQTFMVRDPFYTRWLAAGGVPVMGSATSGEVTATSAVSAATANTQSFVRGGIFMITSGALNGRQFTVIEPAWSTYRENRSLLGLPTGEELDAGGGVRRQTFEGGAIEFAPGGGASLRLPVNAITLNIGSPTLRLNLGERVTVQARTFAANGQELTGRNIGWLTTNGRVASVESSGSQAVIRAVGGGIATVTATSEGRVSAPVTVVVTAPCCQVGEGAPTLTIQQAFQDAANRSRLSLRLPTAGPVRRWGGGFVQEFLTADGAARVVIAQSDRSAVAFVVFGPLLSRWEELGGPVGVLGYPGGDATGAGRQLFENGALAGTPARVVSGAILARWAQLGYEAAIGLPLGDASAFFTFAATRGEQQPFQRGLILASAAGLTSTRTNLVSGPILAAFLAAGGVGGTLGAPTSDEVTAGGRRRQEFEGGSIEYTEGATAATVAERERQPVVNAAPATVIAGSRVRLSVGGFDTGATLRVSVSGQPDFVVPTENGAFAWEAFVPADARSGVVVIRAEHVGGAARAQGGYVVRRPEESTLTLSRLSGDLQVGTPGTLLPLPLRVVLRDGSGNALVGVPVQFNPSPGAQITRASPATDDQGEAEAWLRLPSREGVALATAAAAGQVTTFSARASGAAIANFPRFTQDVPGTLGNSPVPIAQAGSLLAAAASVLRFHQDRGEMAASNGLADPVAINSFLTSFCVLDVQAQPVCDGYIATGEGRDPIVNLWRLAAFTGGNVEVSVEEPRLDTVRDLVGRGSPVLLVLSLSAGDQPLGSHWVVATGVNPDGTLSIHDPQPALGRANLNDYFNGFQRGGSVYRAMLTGAVRLLPRVPVTGGFLVNVTGAVPEVTSSAGPCGTTLEFADLAARVASPGLDSPPWIFRQRYCDGTQGPYQLDVVGGGTYRGALTDLALPANRMEFGGLAAGAFRVAKPGAQWILQTQQAEVLPNGVLNAADFSTGLAPGGLMAIFGTGLARATGATTVDVSGLPAPVVASTPFQVNAQIPLTLAPGSHILTVRSPFGSASQPIQVQDHAPAIFLLARGAGAVLNQDGTLNQGVNPLRRGQVLVVFCTGLGAVRPSGGLQVAEEAVTAVLGGQELPVQFAGLTPGFVGLYQVNVAIPATTPPGLNRLLALRQGRVMSNAVSVAIQ